MGYCPQPRRQYELAELLLTMLVSSDDWLRPYQGLLPRTDSRSDKDGFVGPVGLVFASGPGQQCPESGRQRACLAT